ncbi:MAG: hypothetical protein P8H03_05845, partial [Emcibacteraceae bacterium]|nr:hypothetical protein [Emcibacteraceae bacterium]
MNVQKPLRKKHIPTEIEADFLSRVENAKYDRGIVAGLKKFADGKVDDDMKDFYSQEEIEAISALKGTNRDLEARMPVKMTRHYFERARVSSPIRTLIKASPNETFDLAGSEDPGKQMSYSPVEGLIHKYELGLIYVAGTCSAHCRFCYREELIAKKEIVREDGSIQAKGLAQIADLVEYIVDHNEKVAANDGVHPETGRERLREILMSGGDPMVLANKGIASWWAALSEAGIESIRLGTKELAFFPQRFDDSFWKMVDDFHATYPNTKLRFMIHFNHPDEFLEKDDDGNYVSLPGGGLKWVDATRKAIAEFGKREYITVDNQSPIIKNINNDSDALRIMQRELRRNKVENHYFFCGRDIVGHKAFNVTIEEAWNILNTSQRGLSGVEAHARLSITHYYGKTEVVAVTNE